MSKPLLGLVLGGVLGIFDGLTALATPEVASQIVGIVIGSTVKGLIAGVLIGWFAKNGRSLTAMLVFGLIVGAFFAFLVAAIPQPSGEHYYWEIVLPGSIVGLLVGYATQRWGGESHVIMKSS
jgi:Na+-transporting NADH:ubiquinone oxidoreductase subunit NqrB